MKIALISTGALSGKSTLARYLHSAYSFVIACHICTLVASYVEAYSIVKNLRTKGNITYAVEGDILTVESVFADKEKYRKALQDHGYAIGFNTDYGAEYWLERTIAQSGAQVGQSIVFDSLRGGKQASILQKNGWWVVQLVISEKERKRRAEAEGKDYVKLMRDMHRYPELEGGIGFADAEVCSDGLTVRELAERVLSTVRDMEAQAEAEAEGC